jgi:hypothetical protein
MESEIQVHAIQTRIIRTTIEDRFGNNITLNRQRLDRIR